MKAKALIIWIPQKISFIYYGEVLKTAIIGFLIYISWPISALVYFYLQDIQRQDRFIPDVSVVIFFVLCTFFQACGWTWIKFSPHA